jgi:hypothetical protein
MKKLIILLVAVLFSATTYAQTKHTTMLETTRDTLYPEIVIDNWGWYEHFQHPATNLICFAGGDLCTSESYNTYLWETNPENMPIGGDLTAPEIYCAFHHSDYLKVTVWDTLGNSGTDSIWFNIKDWTVPIDDFTMEIDSSNHAVFSGTVTPEQTFIGILRSLDTLNWLPVYGHQVTPGHWSWRDEQVHFSPDSIWNYVPWYVDSCDNELYPEMVPGMMMSTQPSPGGGWYLTFHTVLQSSKSDDYVYPIFTIDQDGVRHQLYDNDGEPVVLPASANSLLLQEHPDKYYQGAVAKMNKKSRNYEIISYSNKVENPLPDVNSVDEVQPPTLSIYPNPSHGTFTVKGEGILTIINMLGQTIFQQRIEGESPIRLPAGIYIAKLGSSIQKIVVK